MRLVRIREVQVLDNYRVRLTLTDGRVVERDLEPMLVGPVFGEIRNDVAAGRCGFRRRVRGRGRVRRRWAPKNESRARGLGPRARDIGTWKKQSVPITDRFALPITAWFSFRRGEFP